MTKYDKILIICVLIISISGMVAVNNYALNFNNAYAEISVNNDLHKKYTLGYGLDETVVIDNEFGKNTIKIENDVVYMLESDCQDQICVHMGRISSPGELIVCLPHRLIIMVTGERQNVDTISH
jgi:hypothetical protein